MRSIQQLIQRLGGERGAAAAHAVPPSRRQLDDYFIFEVDGNPVACVALHAYPEESKGELACLCVRASHENQGIGRRMVQFVESRAREAGLDALFALSTQAFNFFQSKAGFAEGSPDDLPPARRETLRAERPALEGAGEEALSAPARLRRARRPGTASRNGA